MKYVIEKWSKAWSSIIDDFDVGEIDENQLSKFLASKAETAPGIAYELDSDEAIALGDELGIDLEVAGGTNKFVLRHRQWFDDLSYPPHTNRELALMLTGVKPLAIFCGNEERDDIRMFVTAFSPHVSDGKIKKAKYSRRLSNLAGAPIVEFIYFSLSGEEWRINAHMTLMDCFATGGWSDTLERFESLLLGYEEKQISEYLKMKSEFFNRQPRCN